MVQISGPGPSMPQPSHPDTTNWRRDVLFYTVNVEQGDKAAALKCLEQLKKDNDPQTSGLTNDDIDNEIREFNSISGPEGYVNFINNSKIFKMYSPQLGS